MLGLDGSLVFLVSAYTLFLHSFKSALKGNSHIFQPSIFHIIGHCDSMDANFALATSLVEIQGNKDLRKTSYIGANFIQLYK